MLVNVTDVQGDHGSVVLFRGTLVDDGREIVFAVDHRMARDLAEALAYNESPLAGVEAWQVTAWEMA